MSSSIRTILVSAEDVEAARDAARVIMSREGVSRVGSGYPFGWASAELEAEDSATVGDVWGGGGSSALDSSSFASCSGSSSSGAGESSLNGVDWRDAAATALASVAESLGACGEAGSGGADSGELLCAAASAEGEDGRDTVGLERGEGEEDGALFSKCGAGDGL